MTKVTIDRELLERIDESAICDGTDATISDDLFTQLVAALAAPQPSAVPDGDIFWREKLAIKFCEARGILDGSKERASVVDAFISALSLASSAPATVQGDADNYRWLRKQHNNVNSDIGVYDGANILATPEGDLDLDAAIAAARQEGGKESNDANA